MSATPQAAHAERVYPPRRAAITYTLLTLVPAALAALAAFTTGTMGWAPWIMFMGWVGYFTRPSFREGLQTYVCMVIGLALGALATHAVGNLTPTVGQGALPSVVFAVACVVVAARGLPILNNLLGYFIGLITFFAAHPAPEVGAVVALSAAVGIGVLAGFSSQRLSALAKR